MTDLQCPRCLIPLEHLHSADVCARYGGVFLGSTVTDTVARVLDPHNQDLSADAARAARVIARTHAAVACPVCRVDMRRYRFGPYLEVDSCHEHGSWYDKGELERLKLALEQGGVAEEVPVAAPPTAAPGGSGLEFEHRERRQRPSPARFDAGGVDPAVQEKILALARFEAELEQQRMARADRAERRWWRRGAWDVAPGDPAYWALDALFDVIRFLR